MRENRIIKFRAWNKKDKLMVYDFYIGSRYGLIYFNETREIIRAYHPSSNFELMQFTGLKDKNGKEIYEGDCLRWTQWEQEGTDKPDIYIIRYKPPSFISECYRAGIKLDGEDILNGGATENFEVIGNIWENPELLPLPLKTSKEVRRL